MLVLSAVLTVICLLTLAYLSFHRQSLETWVAWLPVPLLGVLISLTARNEVIYLIAVSAMLAYCAWGVIRLRRTTAE